MPQRPIEIFLYGGEKVSVLTIDASAITGVWVCEPNKDDEKNFGRSPYKTYLTTTIASYPQFDFFDNGQFEDRLAYVRAAERAIDDPISRPSRAMASASKGTHSQGLSRPQVEEIAQAMLTPQQFNNAKMRADKAPRTTSAFSEFLARNAMVPASPAPAEPALPEIDLGARVRSRTAYPGKTDTTLEVSSVPDPLAPKP